MSIDDKYVTATDKRRIARWNMRETFKRVHFVTTADGWEIAITQYSEGGSRKFPVLLCHGLGANRWVFDTDPSYSLTQYLVQQGYEVYAIELRGHGRAEKPNGKDKTWGWGLNDYAMQDLDAGIDRILSLSGSKKLHYIGHSMGGACLYLRAAVADQRIQSGIAIASALDVRNSGSLLSSLRYIRKVFTWLPFVPVHWVGRASSFAAQCSVKLIDPSLVHPANVDRSVFIRMCATVLHPVSANVFYELGGAVDGRGIRTADGETIYADRLQQQGYGFPLLSIAGSKDKLCPPSAVQQFGTQHTSFGLDYGHQSDYGHHDLLMGLYAPAETWPVYLEWLGKHELT